MRDLDFNLLLDLDALLREGSVAGAARRLHISAPAMSRRLARLRENIGDPLFVPAGRGLVPTQRALALRGRVQAAIEELRNVFAPLDVDFARLERTLTLRANDGFAGHWAARLAACLAAQAPGVSLRFIPRAEKGMAALRDGLVDLDLGVLGAAGPEIYNQSLFRSSFVGVVRADHPLSGKEVNVTDFVAWPHISASRRGLAHGPIDEALKAHGLRRKVGMVAPGFQAALAMAAGSDFVAAMPEPFARWAMTHQRLHIFKLPVATPEVEISQSWHPRFHADPVHRWLREQVRAISSGSFDCRTQ